MENNSIFTPAVAGMQASAIREIFKMLGVPGMISFAAGIPAPELFPAKQWAEINREILIERASGALVYGTTEGYAPLREYTKEQCAKKGIYNEKVDELIITSGAQQAIDLSAKVLINPGDGVICEAPSFIGSLNSFRSYGAKLYGAAIEEDGICLEDVENYLKTEKNIKFIYTISTFQNPSGVTMSLEKRKKLLALAESYGVLILEDNPYGELRFTGETIPAIKTMDTKGTVIYAGTYSKTLAPGLRVGYLSARKDIVDRVTVVKQVNDVHTPVLNQMMVHEYVTKYDFEAHIEKCAKIYGERCALMLSEMDKHFPKECTYTRPEGGIFILCTLPKGTDTKVLMQKAIEKKVAFVPGATFMLDLDEPSNLFRLNFSVTTPESITKGIAVLGEVIKEYLQNL